MAKLTITPERQKTADLFDAYLVFGSKAWTPKGQEVANIFNAFHTSAFSAEQVGKIAAALYGYTSPLDYQDTLTTLCRAKVLRSRADRGKRLYEVNY